MRSPIGMPSVGKAAMKTKFDPVKRPKSPLGDELKLNKGGVVKKKKK